MTQATKSSPLSELRGAIHEVIQGLDQIAAEMAQVCGERFRSDLGALDAALYCLLGVFMPALDRWGRQQREVVWRDAQRKRASPSFVFVGLLASMLNSTLATRHLAVRGFDRQARVVFRELTEVGDLLLAVIADESLLDHYLDSPADFDDAYDHWAKLLRPAKLRSRVGKLAKAIGFGKDADTAGLLDSRWALYEWLSKSAHVDYGALVLASVAGDPDGRYDINLGGRVGGHTEATLRHLADYLHVFLILLALFLAGRHGWTRDDPELHEPLLLVRQCAEQYTAFRAETS